MSSRISKSNLVLFLFAITLPLMSCKNIVNNGDLEVTVIPKTTQAIPATTKSCDGVTDINDAYVIYPTLKYTWRGDNPLQIDLISVRFQSSYLAGDGTYTKILAGDDLEAALGSASRNPPKDAEQTAGCGIRVGGIELNAGVNYASVSGYMKILAVEVMADGTVNQVTSEIPISFNYEKF